MDVCLLYIIIQRIVLPKQLLYNCTLRFLEAFLDIEIVHRHSDNTEILPESRMAHFYFIMGELDIIWRP